MKAFAEKFDAGPGWTFLTGKPEDIELLSRKLGLYTPPDPENKDGHTPALLIGNEATGQWIHGSAVDNPKMMATMLGEWVGGYAATAPARSYADAPPLPKFDSGRYVFSSKCAACHTLGAASRIGPDLSNVTRVRDRDWLARYIAAPEIVLQVAGDPIAAELAAKYKQVRMPNLQLTAAQIQGRDRISSTRSRVRRRSEYAGAWRLPVDARSCGRPPLSRRIVIDSSFPPPTSVVPFSHYS